MGRRHSARHKRSGRGHAAPLGKQRLDDSSSFLRILFPEGIASAQLPDLASASYSYDNDGRLQAVTQGARSWSYAYDADGYLASITDPLSRVTSFGYDAAGRVSTQTLPDQRQIGFSYDADGNVTAVTPPGRPAHAFSHNNVGQSSDYDPPGLTSGPTPTSYTYNDDHELTKITRPDATDVDLTYDTAGRPKKTIEASGEETTLSYGSTSGHLEQIASPDNVTLDLEQDGPLPTKQTLWVQPTCSKWLAICVAPVALYPAPAACSTGGRRAAVRVLPTYARL